ncbi:hypothetical protein B0H13DRAFT_1896054 [Mycena leptocephala]|nr:hypothetical protein B0H13DRAFT_1896054 [Mycena leptocephala]
MAKDEAVERSRTKRGGKKLWKERSQDSEEDGDAGAARMHTALAAHEDGDAEDDGGEDVLAPAPVSTAALQVRGSTPASRGREITWGRGERRGEGGRDEGGWAPALDKGEGAEEMYAHSVSIHACPLICIVIRSPSARFSFSIHLRRPAREMHEMQTCGEVAAAAASQARTDLTALPLAHEEQGDMCSFHGTRTPTGEKDGSEPKKAASARTPRAWRTQKGKRAEHTELSVVCASARRNEAGCRWPGSHKSVHGGSRRLCTAPMTRWMMDDPGARGGEGDLRKQGRGPVREMCKRYEAVKACMNMERNWGRLTDDNSVRRGEEVDAAGLEEGGERNDVQRRQIQHPEDRWIKSDAAKDYDNESWLQYTRVRRRKRGIGRGTSKYSGSKKERLQRYNYNFTFNCISILPLKGGEDSGILKWRATKYLKHRHSCFHSSQDLQ